MAIDPPLHRTFKRLINRYFTPAAVTPWEGPTRELVNHLVDGFVEQGACDFMADFHSTFNRAPLSVPITFTPGARS